MRGTGSERKPDGHSGGRTGVRPGRVPRGRGRCHSCSLTELQSPRRGLGWPVQEVLERKSRFTKRPSSNWRKATCVWGRRGPPQLCGAHRAWPTSAADGGNPLGESVPIQPQTAHTGERL